MPRAHPPYTVCRAYAPSHCHTRHRGTPTTGRSSLTPRYRTCWEGMRRRAPASSCGPVPQGLTALSRPGHQLSTFILRRRPSPRAVCTLWPPSARGRLPGNVSSWPRPPGPPLPAPNRCGVTQHRQLLDTAWRPLSSLPWLRVGPQFRGSLAGGGGVAQPWTSALLLFPRLARVGPPARPAPFWLAQGWGGVSREGLGPPFCSCRPGPGGADDASAV